MNCNDCGGLLPRGCECDAFGGRISRQALADAKAERTAPTSAAGASEVEFELHCDGDYAASTLGPRERASAEIQHYAAQYAQDGPIEIYEVTRTRMQASGSADTDRHGSNELTSSPEPAPALRAAEWVETANRLAEEIETAAILYGDSAPDSLNEWQCQERMHAARKALHEHLSRASGLLPVAREGLSDETKALYDELLLAVHRKFPDESRHETALRYIRNAESAAQQSEPAAAAIRRGGA